MSPTISLVRREFTAYFLSPIAYVVLAVFALVTGHLFYLTLNLLTEVGPQGTRFPMTVMLGDEKFWLVFLFIPPLLTMRLFAEERGTGTLEMLMTAPVRDWQAVLAKYIACFGFYLLMWLPTLVYLPVLLDLKVGFHPTFTLWSIMFLAGVGVIVLSLLFGFVGLLRGWWIVLVLMLGVAAGVLGGIGHFYKEASEYELARYYRECLAAASGGLVLGINPEWKPLPDVKAGIDPYPVLTSYIGVFLAGAMFLGIGLFISSLVRSQMVAALIALIIGLALIVAGFWRPEMDSSSLIYRMIFFFSVPLHFSRDFTRGILDTRHLVLYTSVALFCLFMTVRSLESRRWK